MREKTIELYLVNRVREAGGLCYKWSSPMQRGVPDRIVMLNKEIYFIEVKATNGKLSRLQDLTHIKLKNAGCYVRTVYNKGDVDAFLESCS